LGSESTLKKEKKRIREKEKNLSQDLVSLSLSLGALGLMARSWVKAR
jgi:hypothetical protein